MPTQLQPFKVCSDLCTFIMRCVVGSSKLAENFSLLKKLNTCPPSLPPGLLSSLHNSAHDIYVCPTVCQSRFQFVWSLHGLGRCFFVALFCQDSLAGCSQKCHTGHDDAVPAVSFEGAKYYLIPSDSWVKQYRLHALPMCEPCDI